MSTSLTAKERETYESIWAFDAYAAHSPGEAYLPLFLDMTQDTMRTSVLDAGCGSGKGALALRSVGFDRVVLCDLTPAGLVPEATALPFVEAPLWSDLKRLLFQVWIWGWVLYAMWQLSRPLDTLNLKAGQTEPQ